MAHWHIEPNKAKKANKANKQITTTTTTTINSPESLSDLDLISAAYHSWDTFDIKHQLDKCYLLNWKPAYLLLQLIDNPNNTLNHQGVDYSIIYYRGHSSGDFKAAKKAAVSFRHSAKLNLSVAIIKFIF